MQDFIENTIKITELHINRAEALRYLHINGQAPAEILADLADAEQQLLQTARPRFTWQEFALQKAETITLMGTNLTLPGSDIAELLQDADRCILLATTLGLAVDELIRRTEFTDMSRALMLDACASAAVENLCDQVQQQLVKQFAAQGQYLTDRFSPGYGDLPLSLQKPLCATLNTQRLIGLTVSGSGILLPRKSVTAIIGISSHPQSKRQSGCATCNLAATCPFRKAGQNCGK